MMNTRGGRLFGAVFCSGLLVLAGCGGDGDSPENSDARSPLAEFMGWDTDPSRSSRDEPTEEERQQHYQVQEYVVECMADLGFEYFPEPFWGDQESHPSEGAWEEAYQLQEDDPEAFAQQYGYGYTTISFDDESRSEEEELDPEKYPNEAYRESLSASAQEEYEKALWGDWGDFDESGETVEEVTPEEAGGCHNEATNEVYGWDEDDGSQFESLWEAWDELYQQIEDDPKVVEVTRDWVQCMADAGYTGLETLQDGEDQVFQRQDEIYGWSEDVSPTLDPEQAEADVDEAGGRADEFPEPDPAELEALREFELAIAWADFECKRDNDVERIRREVEYAHEERFIEENRADLEAYRDWHNERGF